VAGGGRIEKFHQPIVFFYCLGIIPALKFFRPLPATRRQAIHRLDFFVLLYQDKRTKKVVEEMISTNGKSIVLVMGSAKI